MYWAGLVWDRFHWCVLGDEECSGNAPFEQGCRNSMPLSNSCEITGWGGDPGGSTRSLHLPCCWQQKCCWQHSTAKLHPAQGGRTFHRWAGVSRLTSQHTCPFSFCGCNHKGKEAGFLQRASGCLSAYEDAACIVWARSIHKIYCQ